MLLKSKNVVKLVSIIILIFDFTSIIEISLIFSGLVKVEYQNAYNLWVRSQFPANLRCHLWIKIDTLWYNKITWDACSISIFVNSVGQ